MFGKSRLKAVAVVALALPLMALPSVASAADTPISTRYAGDAKLQTLLGSPEGKEFSIANGRERNYEHGSLYYSKPTGVRYVLDKLNDKYALQGGPTYFGFPTTDQEDVYSRSGRVGVANSFTKGQIVLRDDAESATWMGSAIAAKWNRQAYPVYGLPIADQVAVEGGVKVDFEASKLYSSKKYGTYAVVQGYGNTGGHNLLTKYESLQEASGFLGLPTSDYKSVPSAKSPNGFFQTFANGGLFASEIGDLNSVHYVKGDVYDAFVAYGGVKTLGYPNGDPIKTDSGNYQLFENGRISHDAATKTTTVVIYPAK